MARKIWHRDQVNTLEFITLPSVCVGACKPTIGCRKGSMSYKNFTCYEFIYFFFFYHVCKNTYCCKLTQLKSMETSLSSPCGPISSCTSWCCFYVMFYWEFVYCTECEGCWKHIRKTIDSGLAQEKHWFVISLKHATATSDSTGWHIMIYSGMFEE